ncbi:mannose-6-phosphate isomerase, class I [Vibrio sp. CAU 1672]|uniref:mannose-6-phosphate isomerase, class I n=1 Tax=Vibrio sp. CAU 1672 TaxID=3032594 RepID=UPI0023DC79A2|nr:mannose-6-phosphate isomerase, class I [Vibrio sp. CAU 1672]MDF2155163.1 mannose-6-phosphate isomerase, class I [Vibrio sp. CAU 1672]
MSISKLDTVIQNYKWGSKSSISQMFGVENPNSEPQAEMWMGAHLSGCSRIKETGLPLSYVIGENKVAVLGDYTSSRFGELPFLLKVLAADTPLSVQVHPKKAKAQAGFERENELKIPLTSEQRNYKDLNHKPELVYALTFYEAMNGFRPIEQIVALFKEANISTLEKELVQLENNPNPEGLKAFFTFIMSLSGDKKQQALTELYTAHEIAPKTALSRQAMHYSKVFKQHYPDDVGLFAPLMLNIIELAPGEAMFLHAEVPHAYIRGTALEIMANSDNVLRAGLTPKHIDIPELIDNTSFVAMTPEKLILNPIVKENRLTFSVPVDDFSFDIVSVNNDESTQYLRSAEILFCIEGEVTICSNTQSVNVQAGESIFITNDTKCYHFHGRGILARAYN